MEGADSQAEGALSKGASPTRLGRSGQGGGVQHPRLARGHRRQKGVGGEDEADAVSEDEPAPGWWAVTLWPAGLFVRAGVMMSSGRCGEAFEEFGTTTGRPSLDSNSARAGRRRRRVSSGRGQGRRCARVGGAVYRPCGGFVMGIHRGIRFCSAVPWRYTVQSASVGDMRAARMAGSRPAMAPMSRAAASPPVQARVGMTVVQCLVWA